MAEETLEEAAKRHADSYYNKNSEFCSVIYESVEWSNRNHNFIRGAEWQQERMYSEEEFKLFARQYYREIKLDKSNLLWDDLADKCLEQFKKK